MVENKLFNEKLMNEYITKYEKQLNNQISNKKSLQIWIDKLNNNDLEDEVKNYSKFTTYILNDLLGYTPEDYIDQESIGDEKRPVDYVLLQNNKRYVAIELKGTSTPDITKRHNRENSAVEQACLYATEQEETKWAIASNYDEFRLFNPKSRNNYISFKFRELIDENTFKKFLLCFSKLSLIDEDIPQQLLKQSTIFEREFEDEFYQLFSETRLMLIKELESSEEIDHHEAIRLAQLILNRYIFICFAEDLKLLPPLTSTNTIMTPIENANLRKNTIWNRLNELFFFVNEGNLQKGINEFNGGLFAEELDEFKIRDMVDDLTFFDDCYKKWKFKEQYEKIKPQIENYKDVLNPIYKNLLTISEFDFESQLDVNILGHIFENSIGDIEELKNEDRSRRKKDGVFYTPEYITDYICRNTIIPYLSKSGKVNTVEELISEYNLSTNELEILDEKLRNIKILDPACGSGAFLNKAADVLLEIHEHYHAVRYEGSENKLDQWFDSVNSRRKILINNIYGVDLNPESVEITKLGMFLKVASKGMKLPNLDKNIKCGNSLIDDENIVGDKAFKWEEEFQEVFENGGFDIIVGNPPYVRQELINTAEKEFLSKKYKSCTKSSDLYVGFFERSINNLKENGYFSFICSNKFITVDYGKNLRKFLLNYKITHYNDYSGENIFEDAEVDPCIIIIKKTEDKSNEIYYNNTNKIPQKLFNENVWFFSNINQLLLRDKILKKGELLKNISSITINNGIKTGYNKAFYIDEKEKNHLIELDMNNSNIIKPLLLGKDIEHYNIDFKNKYLIFTRQGIEIDNYPKIKEYLYTYIEDLTPKNNKTDKKGRKSGNYKWYEIQDKTEFYENFEKPKLIWAEMNKEISFCYDDKGYFVNNKCFIITCDDINILLYLNGLFLSDLFRFIFKTITSSLGKKSIELRKSYINNSPIILSEKKCSEININVSEILNKKQNITQEKNGFKKWIKRTYNIEKLSKKLEKYYELNFEDFLKELKKKKVDTKQRKTQELLEKEFTKSLNKIITLQNEINKLENNINQLVYELYDLTQEEIQIIEDSFK